MAADMGSVEIASAATSKASCRSTAIPFYVLYALQVGMTIESPAVWSVSSTDSILSSLCLSVIADELIHFLELSSEEFGVWTEMQLSQFSTLLHCRKYVYLRSSS